MAVYIVKGARNNILGEIADAGPFEVFLNNEATGSRAGIIAASSLSVHDPYDDTDSKLEDIKKFFTTEEEWICNMCPSDPQNVKSKNVFSRHNY